MKYQVYKIYIITLLIAGTLLASCSGSSERMDNKEADTDKTQNKDK